MTAGTLSLVPEAAIERVSHRPAYRAGRERGRVMARQVQERERRQWMVTWGNAHDGDRALILTAFGLAGTARDLDWTPPGESAIRVAFVEPPNIVATGLRRYEIELTLEEVL